MSPETAGAIAIAKDIATGAAAVVAATVAVVGLKAWRRQLHGQTRYDQARRLLRAVYRARDQLQGVRNPLILPSEVSAARKEAEITGDDKAITYSAEDHGAVYRHRWNRIASAMSDLELELTEAEAIFGRAVVEQLRPFRDCVADLFWNLRRFLQRKVEPSAGFDPEAFERIEAIVYMVSDDPDKDQFTAKITAAVAQVEKLVRPFLKLA